MAFNNEDFLHFTLGMSFSRIPSLSSKTMALFLSGKHFFQDFINLSLQKCLYDQAVMAFDQYLRYLKKMLKVITEAQTFFKSILAIPNCQTEFVERIH